MEINKDLEKGGGLRFNENKTRHDLVPTFAQEQYAKVLTVGAEKYGERNWQKGMSWKTVIASMKRHTIAIERGEDIDPETGLLHSAHIMCNAAFLTEYYNIYQEGDDREHWFKKPLKRVYLDIDGVCADFETHFLNYFQLDQKPINDWNDYRFRKHLHKMKDNDDFLLSIPSIIKPTDIIYPITGYCTARECSTEIIEEWLEKNDYPYGEVINVGLEGNKYDALKDKCDVLLDDSIYNFMNMQKNGIMCYLMDRPHNKKYDVGSYRVSSFKEFIEKIK